MPDNLLSGMNVAILATDLFEQSELLEPKKALEQAGAKVTVIAPKAGEIQGVQHDKKDQKVRVDLEFSKANPADFDAVMLPGGAMNADALRMERKAQEFVQQIDRADKPIAVICHGAWLLVSAGLVRGRKMTSYYTIQDDLRNAGAEWHDQPFIRERNMVSSRKPDDLAVFNSEMVSLFQEYFKKHGQRLAA